MKISSETVKKFNFWLRLGYSLLIVIFLSSLIWGIWNTSLVYAANETAVTGKSDADVRCWAFLSAAISSGISAVAAGIAVAYVGAAAMGAVAERPEIMGRALIFVGLAEGLAIYGLIIAIMILGKV